jgi:hypothetical protein
MSTSLSRALSESFPKNKTYLQRCVEDLNRTDELAKQCDHKATAYKVAAYATIGLFIAAAAAASILIGIYFSPFLPAVGITTICLFKPVLDFIKKKLALAEGEELRAKRTRGIGEEYQKILKNPEEAQKSLQELSLYSLDKDTDYKPLLANYNYWNKLWTEKEAQLQKKLADAKKKKLSDRITTYIAAAPLRKEIHAAKISQASITAVLNNPEFTGMPEDLAYIKDYSLPVKGVALETNEWIRDKLLGDFGDEEAEAYLVFQNREVKPLTYKQVEEMSPDELSLVFDLAIRRNPFIVEGIAS